VTTRTATIRSRIQDLLRQHPFRPFMINMENGDRISVEHPENIAFYPGNGNSAGGSNDFYAITSGLWYYGTFDAVTGVVREQDPMTPGD
jgi:hypothetical protein